MPASAEIRHVTEELVASFGSGIRAVEAVIGRGLETLDGYRMEQGAVVESLRERFAVGGSLRRKDFDGVMERILSFQSRRESEIKALIRDFLSRHQEVAAALLCAVQLGKSEEVERAGTELAAMAEAARKEIEAFQKEQARIRRTFARFETGEKQASAREFKKAVEQLERELLGSAPTAVGSRAVA